MSRSVAYRACLVAAALLGGDIAWAEDSDASALMLADEAPGVREKASDWRAFVEGAVGGAVRRGDGATDNNRRLSLDIQYDHNFSPEWRTFLANRLDMDWPARDSSRNGINTLKEAYLSWRAQTETILDMGRVNVRNGVAMGYNPTDYFRDGALRSVVSTSPASLKENRQGSIMLRAQRLWDGGSLTALYSPDLKRQPDSSGLSLDVGATNHQNRWLVTVSQKVGDTLTPQFLIYHEEQLPTQFGLNLTRLVDDATVAHFEWSAGRAPSLLTQALRQAVSSCPGDTWRNRLSTGLTHTTPNRISLTVEYHYNGCGLDEAAWDALRKGPPGIYGQYRNWIQNAQELPTRRAIFLYGTWQDALINRLDLSVMHNFDVTDSSRRLWLEARYHIDRFEYAAQWQRNSGAYLSNFGAIAELRSWQALIRYYF